MFWPALILGLVALAVAALMWSQVDRLARLFKRAGALMVGERLAHRVYTERNLKWGVAGWFVVGGLLVAMSFVPARYW